MTSAYRTSFFTRMLAPDHGCEVTLRANETMGIATVQWHLGDGSSRAMSIVLNDGDYDRLYSGADPVADGWEDGNGLLVCYYNSREVVLE